MTKYTCAKAGIELAEQEAAAANVERSEVLLALVVSAVDAYKRCAGSDEARKALAYELDHLGGTVDTVFLRSR